MGGARPHNPKVAGSNPAPATKAMSSDDDRYFIVTTLGVALAFGLVACDSEDDPSVTTTAPGSVTTEPVGS